ncbi:IucA/IucC family protein [Geobacillus subterraneus]|uniref:IucA/IucC family protein n=1 Tax=Geobacillus subterraneus TaxID=129338 RepID=UPI002AC9B5F5|nr:IucA/IucC family protein [Geobacillus subterraneus]WPZ18762.1 IucA/IucC family protein [Geobacillus subterraneus]
MHSIHLFLDEEEKTYQSLQTIDPSLARLFLSILPNSRRRIAGRLLQALIRERLIPPDRVIWKRAGEEWELFIPLSGTKQINAAVAERFSLGQFVTMHLWLLDGKERTPLSSPLELLELLRSEGLIGSAPNWSGFCAEIANSVVNDALALAAAERRRSRRRDAYGKCSSSLEWVRAQPRPFSPLVFYEQAVIDGHTLHPCAKTRLGFSVQDMIEYSPEWEATVSLPLLAVHRSHCRFVSFSYGRMADWVYEQDETLQSVVQNTLRAYGLSECEYDVIPVHPWQWKHVIQQRFQQELAAQTIVPIDGGILPAYPLVSVRTFMIPSASGDHLKTPVNVQMTSAIRTVSPAAAANGPRLSAWLADVLTNERLAPRFRIVSEKAGICFLPRGRTDEETAALGKQLSAIVRDNPERGLAEGEIALPAVALLSPSFLSNKPVAAELVEEYAEDQAASSMHEAALSFFRQYAETLIPPLLVLLCKYGISLEAHLQNSVPVFRRGVPQAMHIRDLGGIRLHSGRFGRHCYPLDELAPSSIVTADIAELQHTFTHAVIHNHLGELIACLSRVFSVEEPLFWQTLADVIEEAFALLARDSEIKEQIKQDREALFSPMLPMKALVAMRLTDDLRNHFIETANPLAKWKREE